MSVAVWQDITPDLVHSLDEPFIHQSGPWGAFIPSFFDVFTEIALYDSTTANGATSPLRTELIAMNLCAGRMEMDLGDGHLLCNGRNMNNQSQTDKLIADLKVYAVQERNNPNFKCSDLSASEE
jgi:hypothetical protein